MRESDENFDEEMIAIMEEPLVCQRRNGQMNTKTMLFAKYVKDFRYGQLFGKGRFQSVIFCAWGTKKGDLFYCLFN